MDKILYGKDLTEGVVGLDVFNNNEMLLYKSDGSTERREFHPYIHATEKAAERLTNNFHVLYTENLDGDLHFQRLVGFKGQDQFYDAKYFLQREFDDSEYHMEYDPKVQWMQQAGVTTYMGLVMDDLDRMQVDIEVYSPKGFPDSDRHEIIIISLCDNNGWELVLHTAGGVSMEGTIRLESEREMLDQLLRVIQRRDPDTLEFHNGLGFDLPYLRDRFEKVGLPFALGRDHSEPKSWETSKSFAEREMEYENFIVSGRSVIDSMFLAADYDTYARDLPGYGLKELAKHFGFAPEDREYVDGGNISDVWDSNPERLIRYALDDVKETRALVEQLGNATFELTKSVPMTWQKTILAGTAGTLESIMKREYIRQGYSLPNGSEPRSFEGGYTNVFYRGVYENCVYADVSSLYPSIMLKHEVFPESDELDVLQHTLEKLTNLRLENKQKLTELDPDSQEYEVVDAEQASQKIMINSSYGMCGHPFSLFSDMDAAEEVTRRGRELLKEMISHLKSEGCTPILTDTDGCMAQLPDDKSAEEVVSNVDSAMPEGIEIDNDGEFSHVMSYKPKNYAKVEAGDPLEEVSITGNSLKGRSKEDFLLTYIEEQIQNLLRRDIRSMKDLHEEYKTKIRNRSFDIERLCKEQRLKKTLDEYEEGVENDPNKHRLAQYEVAKRKWKIENEEPRKGDVVKYYVSDTSSDKVWVSRDARLLREYDGDESIKYYLKRLDKTADLFRPLVDRPNVVFDSDVSQQTSLFGDPTDEVSIVHEQLTQLP